jgi:hypothetical protein
MFAELLNSIAEIAHMFVEQSAADFVCGSPFRFPTIRNYLLNGLAGLLAFRRLEIRQDTNVSHQSHCHSRMRRRVAVAPCQIVVPAHFPTRITYGHGDDHRSRGRCPLRGRRNDRVGRRTGRAPCPLFRRYCYLMRYCFTATQYRSL